MKKLMAFLMAFVLCLTVFVPQVFAADVCTDDSCTVHNHVHNHEQEVTTVAADAPIYDYPERSASMYVNLQKSSYTYRPYASSMGVTLVIDSETIEPMKEAYLSITIPSKLLSLPQIMSATMDSTNLPIPKDSVTTGPLSSSTSQVLINIPAGVSTFQGTFTITMEFTVDDDMIVYDWLRENTIACSGYALTTSGERIGFDSQVSQFKVYVCSHPHTEYHVIKEATCQEEGRRELRCTTCNCVLRTETIRTTPHNLDLSKAYNTNVYKPVMPTCTSPGYGSFKCKDCGKLITGPVPPLPHTYGERKLDPVTGQYYQECTVCHQRKISTNQCPHPVEDYKKIVTIEEPTCQKEGLAKFQCPICHAIEERKVPRIPHNVIAWNIEKQPTCTEKGVKSGFCTMCEQKVKEEIPALGHSYGEWRTEKKATCISDGLDVRVCTRCGAREERVTKGSGHQFGPWVTTKEPTCVTPGTSTRTCELCGETETREIPIVSHTFGEWTTRTAPTCVKEGVSVRVCSVCGKEETRAIPIAPDAHNYGEWTVVTPKTCLVDGEKTHTCTLCGKVENEVDPCTGHVMGPATVDGKTTTKSCTVCGYKEVVITGKKGNEKELTSTVGSLDIIGADADRDLAFEMNIMDMEKQKYYKDFQNFENAYTFVLNAAGEPTAFNSNMALTIELDHALDKYDTSLVVLRNNAFYTINDTERKGNMLTASGEDLIGAEAIFVVKGEEMKGGFVVPIVISVVVLIVAAAAIFVFMKKNKGPKTFD